MLYFRQPESGEVFAFATAAERAEFGRVSLEAMTEEQVQLHLASPVVVPQSVTRFQARAALHLAGLLPQVEALMGDVQTDMLARLAWTDAQEFRRQSPTVLAMAGALGLTEQQLDDLFTTAAGIEA